MRFWRNSLIFFLMLGYPAWVSFRLETVAFLTQLLPIAVGPTGLEKALPGQFPSKEYAIAHWLVAAMGIVCGLLLLMVRKNWVTTLLRVYFVILGVFLAIDYLSPVLSIMVGHFPAISGKVSLLGLALRLVFPIAALWILAKQTGQTTEESFIWSQFRKNRLAVAGLFIAVALFYVAILAPWMSPLSPTAYDLNATLLPPSSIHPFGTDEEGRDVLARMIYGARISLSVGFISVVLYVAIGILLGALAGYFGGWVDIVISRLIEIMMCFPTFFLILAVLAFIGPSLVNIMAVIGLTSWPGIARLVRGEFLKLRGQDFVTAGKLIGAGTGRIIFKHILPNSMAPVLVSATFGIASSILIESSLSFLGFGVQPPTPSWGEILSQSRDFMDIAWWLALFPGIAIFVSITAYNLVGEGLRDAIDPRMKA